MLSSAKTSVYHHFLAINQNKNTKSEKMLLFAVKGSYFVINVKFKPDTLLRTRIILIGYMSTNKINNYKYLNEDKDE
jgi:hypothetical protein